MKAILLSLKWLAALAGILSVVLFVLQNLHRTTQLSLDLGIVAWQLQEPASLPAVIGIAILLGFFVGAAIFGNHAMRLNRRLSDATQTSRDSEEPTTNPGADF
jgi:uncharacterized integral membrane protein